jgi:uncharacterized membrane protein YfcA
MMLMTELPYAFMCLLPIVAFLYASIGHGGASGYLALMAIFSLEPKIMKATALLLNLFVAGIAFYQYHRAGHFNKKLFVPFALTSIPLAFLGGTINIDAAIYKKILGVFLVFAILKMLGIFGKKPAGIENFKTWQGIFVGGSIGFFSGLIGIGGGIVLTPIILLFRWGEIKEAAAVSALFIWVNSAAGLTGQFFSGVTIPWEASLWVAIALVGGFFGSCYGSKKFNNRALKYTLAFVLVIASAKLFLI